jgi:hypothetical protein
MPRIPDSVLDCVVFLYPSIETAKAGTPTGATGFVVTVPSTGHPDLGYCYVVTNAHVIQHGRTVVRVNLVNGATDARDLAGSWECHPDGDDIAIAPIGRSDRFLMRGLLSTRLITHDYFARANVGIGDEVYLVGRFVSYDGQDKNLPVVQRGTVASRIGTIENPETGHQQLSILVELRSMSGYSGSPVFLDIYEGSLLGINFCHLPVRLPVRFGAEGEETEYYVKMPSGMAAVVPAWKLTDLLEQFVKQRESDDELIARERKRSPVELDDAGQVEPTQKSRAGIDIPIPTREQVESVFKKATRKRKP